MLSRLISPRLFGMAVREGSIPGCRQEQLQVGRLTVAPLQMNEAVEAAVVEAVVAKGREARVPEGSE